MSASRNGYIGRAPADSSVIIARKTYEPTGVQTNFTFSAGYTPGYCDVYLNGVKLIDSTDYTATGGSIVGLTSAANSGDGVEVVAYKAFNLGVPLSNITGNLDITGNISASSSITVDSGFYGDGSNLSGVAGAAITQYVSANSLTVLGSPGVSTITRLGATDLNVTGIITANGLSGNVTGTACTFTTGTFNSDVSIGGTLTYEDVTNVDSVGLITARAGVNVSGGELKVGSAVTVSGVGVATFIGAAGVAVTITPSTGKVQATTFEGPLTGNVTGNVSGSSGSATGNAGGLTGTPNISCGTIAGSTGSFTGDVDIADKIVHTGDTNTAIRFPSVDTFTVETAGTERIRVTSTGELKVNTGSGTEGIQFQASSGSNANLRGVGTNYGELGFFIGNSEKLRLDSDGRVGLGTTNPAFFVSIRDAAPYIRIEDTAAPVNEKTWDFNAGTDGILRFRNTNDAANSSNNWLEVERDGVDTSSIRLLTGTGSERLRLDSSGRLLLGTTTEGNGNADNLTIADSAACGITIRSASNNVGSVYFSDDTSGTGEYMGMIGYDHSQNSLTFSTLATTALTISSGQVATFANDIKNLKSGQANVIIGSSDAGGAALVLDGDSDGDASGGDYSYLMHNTSGDLVISVDNPAGGGSLYLKRNGDSDYAVLCYATGATELRYQNTKKFETTNDGVSITGIATVTQGLNTDGLLSEKFETTAGKLSDNTNIDLEDGMVHYFSTQETTTSTPNIRYSSSKSLNNMLSTGDAITVTIITTAAAGGYSANVNIDGNGQTEEWVGGSAPSAGGSDGLDIYTYNILKTSSSPAYKVIANVVNATN